MAVMTASVALASTDMKNEDLLEISNIFASEFNSKEIHDRVLCFQIIDDTEVARRHDSDDTDDSDIHESENESGSGSASSNSPDLPGKKGWRKRSLPLSWSKDESNAPTSPLKSARMYTRSLSSSSSKPFMKELCAPQKSPQELAVTPPALCSNSTTALKRATKYSNVRENRENGNSKKTIEQNKDGAGQHQLIEEEQKLQNEGEKCQKTTTTHQNKEVEGSSKDGQSKTNENENKPTVSKLFVHSQLLAVQSPCFKALFYSGMKETYSKEVVMKIHEHELEAHQILIEAMYKLDVLSDKEYRLVVQVLVLAHKYDARYVFKKYKYVVLSTTPCLEMCEYILKEIKHLSETADIHEMMEKFLVKEFTPFDDTWTLEKFNNLSEAALRLLLRSDNLGTRSENTIFVALMNWVRTNLTWIERMKCDLLSLVRFEFMSVNFLYDVVQNHIVACRMPGFQQNLLNGLAYHAFSQTRREQLEPKPKKRPVLPDATSTFSWEIDEKLQEKLTKSPGTFIFSKRFWYKGYQMQLELSFSKDVNKCDFFFTVRGLQDKAYLHVSYKAKASLFKKTIWAPKQLFTAEASDWGYEGLECNKAQMGKSFTIDVWVEIHE